jgi:uncharacterized protein (DUF1810 family)
MDKFNLKRFIKAQNDCFEIVYEELKNGKKESHWMWYIFPQLFGLGKSQMSVYYAINNLEEAKAYLENEILRDRLLCLVDVVVNLETNDAVKVFGFPDNLKFWSSMTLFNYANPSEPLFKMALDKFFQGRLELATIEILKDQEK